MADPVSRHELHAEVASAEERGEKMVDHVVSHFEQRLKDTERVLTWRMIAVGGMTGVLTSFIEVFARGEQSVVARIFGFLGL
jgi:hypothetical protein